jgi:PPOX class probable F420-dependent enzyme
LTSAREGINNSTASGGGEMTADALRQLRDERYFNLETFKKDGGGVKTPVWFAESDGGLVVFTDGTSYKVKRIRRNPSAKVAACDARGKVHGPWFDAKAEIVPKGAETDAAYAALRKKYGWQMRLLDVVSTIGGRIGRREIIRVTF